MARDFSASGTLGSAGAPLTGMPCTIAMWLQPVGTANSSTLAGISDNTNNNRLYIQRGTAANPSAARASEVGSGSSVGAITPDTPVNDNTWGHWAATFTNINLRSIFFNGADKSSNGSGTGALATLTNFYLAATGAGVAGAQRFIAAEIGVWNVVLSDSDIALLGSSKYAPSKVQPANLVAYWPLFGDASPEPDGHGTHDMTLTGSVPQAAHPPGIVYPEGTLASTLAALTLSAAGNVADTSALTSTLDALTGSATGQVSQVQVLGTLAATLDALADAEAGTVKVTGSQASTFENVSGAATTRVAVVGTLAATLAALASDATAQETVAGTLAATLAALALSATGVGQDVLVGALNMNLDDATLAATGGVRVVGTLDETLGELGAVGRSGGYPTVRRHSSIKFTRAA